MFLKIFTIIYKHLQSLIKMKYLTHQFELDYFSNCTTLYNQIDHHPWWVGDSFKL